MLELTKIKQITSGEGEKLLVRCDGALDRPARVLHVYEGRVGAVGEDDLIDVDQTWKAIVVRVANDLAAREEQLVELVQRALNQDYEVLIKYRVLKISKRVVFSMV